MSFRFEGVQICAITAALPKTQLDIKSLAPLYGETEVKRLVESTGVSSVRVAGKLRTSDLCVEAARHLLKNADVSTSYIEAIVVVTQTPDDFMPGVAMTVHERLGLPRHCLTFDLNYGCPGFVYGLFQAAMLVRSGLKNVLLCAGDVTSKLIKPDDRHLQAVFGDGVGAALLGPGSEQIDFLFDTDGAGKPYLHTPLNYDLSPEKVATVGHLQMDGSQVMTFALSRVPGMVSNLLEQCGLKQMDIDLAFFHQANLLMLKYLKKLSGFTSNQWITDLAETGNTGPASIPLLISRLQASPETRFNQVMLCGFGIGLSVGVAITSLNETQRISPVEVG